MNVDRDGGWPAAALVLAAGLSRRMGGFKMLLPWQGDTVIGRVVATLAGAGVEEILVVTGHRAGEVAAALAGLPASTVFNPAYAAGEMLSSIQVGLAALAVLDSPRVLGETGPSTPSTSSTPSTGPQAPASALLCLGDQPQMERDTVRAVLAAGEAAGWDKIVIPSYRMRAGHPILLPRTLWPEIMGSSAPLNAVLRAHREGTVYLTVNTPSILADLDTPEDYKLAEKN